MSPGFDAVWEVNSAGRESQQTTEQDGMATVGVTADMTGGEGVSSGAPAGRDDDSGSTGLATTTGVGGQLPQLQGWLDRAGLTVREFELLLEVANVAMFALFVYVVITRGDA